MLKILFVPIDAVGHMNSAIGVAQVLAESGHQIIFAINEQWRGKLKRYGFEEVIIAQENRDEKIDPAKRWAQLFLEQGLIAHMSPLESALQLVKIRDITVDEQIKLDAIIEGLLPQIKPDVIICDQVQSLPSVETSGIPWVLTCSCNPLYLIDDERTPPAISGLPALGHEIECKNFRNTVREAKERIINRFNDYITSRGAKPLKSQLLINPSPFLNIYGFPSELDYTDLRPLPPKWHRFDNLKRTEEQANFEIPNELLYKPGKLIYLSMGSMGGANVGLMKRLVSFLRKCKHRFIVSKGPLHHMYELSDNMWGESKVSQMDVLSIVDLVITHGGNNTVTETFFYGKPMIVMPLFADQFDNAQRIHEKGLGIRLDPYDCIEEQLLGAIEMLLNDIELNQKLKNISKRIQTDKSIAKLPQIIESLVLENLH